LWTTGIRATAEPPTYSLNSIFAASPRSLDAVDRPSVIFDFDGQDEANAHWIEVGQKLKAIDRNLFKDWKRWTDGFQSSYKCTVIWNYFAPRCCDVHSASYSGIRDTLLKLLRPGINYKKVFERQCLKKWLKMEKQAEEQELEHGVKEIVVAEFKRRDARRTDLGKTKEQLSELRRGKNKSNDPQSFRRNARQTDAGKSQKEIKKFLETREFDDMNEERLKTETMENMELDKSDMRSILKEVRLISFILYRSISTCRGRG